MSTKAKKPSVSQRHIASMEFLKQISGSLTFGGLLRAIRLGEEETQEVFASRLGISKQHLSDIENSRRNVSPQRAALFAKKLGYSSERFIELALQDAVVEAGFKNYKVRLEAV